MCNEEKRKEFEAQFDVFWKRITNSLDEIEKMIDNDEPEPTAKTDTESESPCDICQMMESRLAADTAVNELIKALADTAKDGVKDGMLSGTEIAHLINLLKARQP